MSVWKPLCVLFFFLSFFLRPLSAQEIATQSLTDTISNEFENLTKKLNFFFFYEIPLYKGEAEISQNKVVNFEKLALDLKTQDSKLYRYLYDLLLQDKNASEKFEEYKYDSKPSIKLVDLFCQRFHLNKEDLKPYHFIIIKDLVVPFPLERALNSWKKIPDNLKKEIADFKGEVSAELKDFIIKRSATTTISEQEAYHKAVLLYGQSLIVNKSFIFDDEFLSELQLYQPIHPVSDELQKILVSVLNLAIRDTNFFYNFSELKKSNQLKGELLKEEIRDFLVAEGIVLRRTIGIPIIILVLSLGGVIFTFLYRFVNFTKLRHGFAILKSNLLNKDLKGEISQFQALSFSLTTTVGLGNIAGIATAICMGGPGIIFWIWVTAIFGMATKFNSCLFSQVYREVDPQSGKVKGGPMYYLSKGIADIYPSLAWLGKTFAVIFSVFCILSSFGGGNLFQINQVYESISLTLHLDGDLWKWIIGFVLALSMAIVTIGGVKKIGFVLARIVPFMCVFYVCTCLIIILKNYELIPSVIKDIFVSAFNFKSAAWGGLMCIFINGVKRATFSNEAGLGSSAIVHATTKTDEPVREGIVAMVEPFIDTILICTITAITILITQANRSGVGEGIQVISIAFASVHYIFLYLLLIAVLLFAFSALITWCYCGERSIEYLFGSKSIAYYRIAFILCIVLGPIVQLNSIIVYSDMMMLCMAFPNIIGGILLFKKGNVLFKDYFNRMEPKDSN